MLHVLCLHSFVSSTTENAGHATKGVEHVLDRGLNGDSTFTKCRVNVCLVRIEGVVPIP